MTGGPGAGAGSAEIDERRTDDEPGPAPDPAGDPAVEPAEAQAQPDGEVEADAEPSAAVDEDDEPSTPVDEDDEPEAPADEEAPADSVEDEPGDDETVDAEDAIETDETPEETRDEIPDDVTASVEEPVAPSVIDLDAASPTVPRFVPPPYDPTIVPSPELVERVDPDPDPEPVDPDPDPVDLDPEPVARVPAVRPPVPEQYVTGAVPILEIEGGWEAVYRRRRRQTLTFLAGLAGVLVVGFIAWLTYAGVVPWPFGGTVSAAQNVCTHSRPLPPKKISVRVFNGSSRDGLAGEVAGRLKGLGFAVKATGNDPLETKIRTAVEIRHGENGDLAAATMVAYVVGKTKDVQDDRQDATVDLVLGPSFARLHTKAELKKSLAAVTATLPMTCPLGVTPPPTAKPTPSPSGTPKARVTPRPTPKR